MVNQLAAFSVLVTLQLIVSKYNAHGGPAVDVNTTISGEERKNASLTNNVTSVPDGYTAFPDIGVAYKYYEMNLTWNLARKQCITDGANLAVIDSFEKQDHANSLRTSDDESPFVGIHRYDNSEWLTVYHDLPLDFVPWDEDSDMNDTTKLCAGLWPSGVTAFWCDVPGSHLCEVEISNQSETTLNETDDKPSLKSIMDIPNGYTVFPDLGVAYKYYKVSLTWNMARKYCRADQAHLAAINSHEDMQQVIQLATSRISAHVGTHRLFDDDEWINVMDDSPATDIPWKERAFTEDSSRKCTVLSTYNGDNGLRAGKCTSLKPFVCEMSIYE